MFHIIGYYEGAGEVVDTVSTRSAANILAAEYRMAFGPDWTIEVVSA